MTPRPFDLSGPLPDGLAVLEASAGTGKTYTIAALTARYVAEGIPLEHILVVTFTRMATGELRERVRERLVTAERALDAVVAGAPLPPDDELVQLLADGAPDVVSTRRDRLARAVADFDAATITTTHGFCLDALGSLGFAGDVERGCAFAEDIGDLTKEVVDDLFVRRFHDMDVLMDRDEAGAIALEAIKNPAAHLVPDDLPDETLVSMRVRLAHVAREELERRKRLASVMTYDDLLTRLDGTLGGEDGEAVAARLRERYRVALVDEFQDTDPVQWSIMRRAFDAPGCTLVLIGDPKQAIYAFRGADVYAYLEAAESTTAQTLAVNWRSDQPLLDAFDQVFRRAQLGHPGITYHPVRAAPGNERARLHGAVPGAALRIRVTDRSHPTIGMTPRGYARKDAARRHIARDLAQELVALLDSGAEIDHPDGRRDRVRPGDIAVLVRRNADAATVRDQLGAAGVPAVINGAGSVFATDSARHWLQLLDALERPTSVPRAHAAALTPFLGWSAERVACAGDEEWEELHDRLHSWAFLLRTSGVAALLAAVSASEGVPARVLGREDGERELTDLRHVGQLLHQAATTEHLGTAALVSWLRRRIADAGDESDEERTRRLESDAAAVQVLTIHRSKGLEFPIVFCPYLWDPSWIPEEDVPVFFHDAANDDRRTLDVGLWGRGYAEHQIQNRHELRGEDLRLAYVALTRARHLVVLWWAGAFGTQNSALHRTVFLQQDDGAIPADGSHVPGDAEAFERFEEVAAGAPGRMSVEWSALRAPASWSPPLEAPAELAAAPFDREIDRAWRRTSYSDITAFAHDVGRVGSEPEGRVLDDEPDEADVVVVAAGESPPAGLEPVPLADMPGGTRIGTLVHEVLEAVDFDAADLGQEVAARLDERLARRTLDVGDPDAVVAGLTAALETPLGGALGAVRLRDVPRADRVDEMAFELPLAGGDVPVGSLTPAAIAAALRRHLPADDPVHRYASRLETGELRSRLHGYLTGSLDLVFRVPGADGGRPRYAIADYKTNRLGDYTRPLTAWDHRPAALEVAMADSHYFLQGLLYDVALHRFLRWRVPGYDAERDLAGVFYLFVRGMTGGDEPAGVVAFKPPPALLDELSDVLDRGAAA